MWWTISAFVEVCGLRAGVWVNIVPSVFSALPRLDLVSLSLAASVPQRRFEDNGQGDQTHVASF